MMVAEVVVQNQTKFQNTAEYFTKFLMKKLKKREVHMVIEFSERKIATEKCN